jgi:hypothetical protein
MGSQRRFGAWTVFTILGIVFLCLSSVEASLLDQRAPELSSTVWINSASLRLADLRGKVILLEFWTYG